jgi:predicted nucleotidyltransferase
MATTLKPLFSSGLRVKLLDHFFLHPGEEFYVRQIAAALNEPVGTVARELSHLEEAGILSFRPVGNQKHYGFNRDCPILEDLRNIFLKTSGASAALREGLKKLSSVEIAFLYGSYASGEAHANSDLDLMIVGKVSDRLLAPAVARVEKHLRREINYTVYTRTEIKRRMGEKGDFVHEVCTGPRIMVIGSEDDDLFRLAE